MVILDFGRLKLSFLGDEKQAVLKPIHNAEKVIEITA